MTTKPRRSKKDLLQLLSSSDHVIITNNVVTCGMCGWEEDIRVKGFILMSIRHFGGNAHYELSNWKLLDIDGELGLRIYKRPLPKEKLTNSKVDSYFEPLEPTPSISTAQNPSISPQPIVSTQIQDLTSSMSTVFTESSATNPLPIACSCYPDLFGVPIDVCTPERVAHLKDSPFFIHAGKNILKRGPVPVGHTVNRVPHDIVLKDTLTKICLVHSFGAGLQISQMIYGPEKTTLKEHSRASTPVLSWIDEDNLREQLRSAKGIHF